MHNFQNLACKFQKDRICMQLFMVCWFSVKISLATDLSHDLSHHLSEKLWVVIIPFSLANSSITLKIGHTLTENFDWKNSTISFTSIKNSQTTISPLLIDYTIPPAKFIFSFPCSGMPKTLIIVELNVLSALWIPEKWAAHLYWDLHCCFQ